MNKRTCLKWNSVY